MKTTETETGLIGALRRAATYLHPTMQSNARLLRDLADDLEALRGTFPTDENGVAKLTPDQRNALDRIATRLTREGDER